MSSSTLLLTLMVFLCFASVNSIGFTIPLIPRFSNESPFYPGKLTTMQKLHELIKLSLPRSSLTNQTAPNNIRLPVHGLEEHNLFVTKLTIGSPPTTQTLILDTGSGIMWTQCRGCTRCFNQTSSMFDPTRSSTYEKFPPVLPICQSNYYKIVNGECRFDISYANGDSASGVVSREKITFDKVEGGELYFNEMIFGCTTDSQDIFFSGGEVSGILGLSNFIHSLPQQLSSIIQGRFSYCLFEGMDSSGVMKFGEDVAMPTGPDAGKIPFFRQNISDHFYLDLVDISLGDQRIGFRPGTFTLQRDGSRGCIIDSGALGSYIHDGPYVVVMIKFDQYFTRRGLRRLRNLPDEDLEYCYNFDPHFRDYISMTFHFADGGDDYVVPAKYMYYFDEAGTYFCVTLFPYNKNTIIGAWQQQNMNIVYDISQQMLHFQPHQCV